MKVQIRTFSTTFTFSANPKTNIRFEFEIISTQGTTEVRETNTPGRSNNCILSSRSFEKTQWRKPGKCKHCNFVSSRESNSRTDLKMHSRDKSNKCNQCAFSSSYVTHLKTHFKTHSGEKPNKCNQCDFASSRADSLRTHLKTHSGEK